MVDSTGIGCRNYDYTQDFIIGIGMMYFSSNLTNFKEEYALLPSLIKS